MSKFLSRQVGSAYITHNFEIEDFGGSLVVRVQPG